MKAQEENSIVQACTALFVAYARHVDFGEYDRFVELFTDDASLNLGFALQGKDKIRRAMSRRSPELRSRHVLTNISIEVNSATSASGIAYLSLYRHVGPESLQSEPVKLRGPAGIGHYSDTFALTNAGWRIASCQLEFAFQDPSQFPNSK